MEGMIREGIAERRIERAVIMNKRVLGIGIACGVLFGATIIAYAITTLFFTSSQTSNLSKKTVFQFDLTTEMEAAEVGPGDSFTVKPVVYNDATEEMYVFVQVDIPEASEGALYSYEIDDGWIPVYDHQGTKVYAYAGSEMSALQPGEETSALTDWMKMNEIGYADYAAIDDINITITAYAMGIEDMSTNPEEAWSQCKEIGNIQ